MLKINELARTMGITFAVMVIILMAAVFLFITPLCWDYAISTWLVHFGRPDNFKLWMAFILCLVPGVGQVGIPVAAVTYVVMMFM